MHSSTMSIGGGRVAVEPRAATGGFLEMGSMASGPDEPSAAKEEWYAYKNG